MIEVTASKCYCGKCGAAFHIEWDLEVSDVTEGGMGECVGYCSEIEYECPNCNNMIYATLYISEYPVGALEFAEVREVHDSEETGRTRIEEPEIAFFDL